MVLVVLVDCGSQEWSRAHDNTNYTRLDWNMRGCGTMSKAEQKIAIINLYVVERVSW